MKENATIGHAQDRPSQTEPQPTGRAAGPATLHTAGGAHRLDVKLAGTFVKRFTGLMFARPLAPDAGLLITQCSSVHTMFMRQAIDVVYLDATGRVLKCVPSLKPWRGSWSRSGRDGHDRRHRRAAHTLELAEGAIARLGIQAGDRLDHPSWPGAGGAQGPGGHARIDGKPQPAAAGVPRPASRLIPKMQRGAAMLEFTVVGPVVTLLGLGILQYGMLFFAKNHINHAAFMAARAGSMGNASLPSVQQAYETALIPLYGGGTNADELKTALEKVKNDTAGHIQIEMLNPTKESFDDWEDPALQATVGKGLGKNGGNARVIPNGGQAFKDPNKIGGNSGQNIGDANLIKLRITHGYEPKVPLMKLVYTKYLQWLDPKTDGFHTQLVNAGRIPVVTHVTLQMQSDAIEPQSPVSMPGMGNNGNPVNPGDPPVTSTDPPNCLTIGCTAPNTPITPVDPGGGGDNGGNDCKGDACPVCPNDKTT